MYKQGDSVNIGMEVNIKELQKEAHAIACEKGWHDQPRSVGDLIGPCHSELSEALESCREYGSVLHAHNINAKPEGFIIELADVIIRVADMAERYGLNLEAAIKMKMDYNRTRPYRHGGKAL